ncbi:MAG: ankyrin repeat domain-containing protein, partial [Akkermansia muciniphila]|nr:ankyrin repeat domain-containing protein [Akkermansia muciniphila]
MKKHTKVVRLLLEKGANPHIALKLEHSALSYTAYRGHTEVVKLLLEYGANVNGEEGEHIPPIEYAARRRYPEIVQLLLEHGADVNAVNDDGKTVLDLTEDEKIIAILKAAGAKSG